MKLWGLVCPGDSYFFRTRIVLLCVSCVFASYCKHRVFFLVTVGKSGFSLMHFTMNRFFVHYIFGTNFLWLIRTVAQFVTRQRSNFRSSTFVTFPTTILVWTGGQRTLHLRRTRISSQNNWFHSKTFQWFSAAFSQVYSIILNISLTVFPVWSKVSSCSTIPWYGDRDRASKRLFTGSCALTLHFASTENKMGRIFIRRKDNSIIWAHNPEMESIQRPYSLKCKVGQVVIRCWFCFWNWINHYYHMN